MGRAAGDGGGWQGQNRNEGGTAHGFFSKGRAQGFERRGSDGGVFGRIGVCPTLWARNVAISRKDGACAGSTLGEGRAKGKRPVRVARARNYRSS